MYIEENSELFIVDRIKVSHISHLFDIGLDTRSQEIMKIRGYQVSPAELEGHLLQHPDIADVCVVGVPDEFSGELPLAFVVLRDGRRAASPTEEKNLKSDIQKVRSLFTSSFRCQESLMSFFFKFVADHKVPYKHLAGGVVFVDVIPKNPSGKLLRRLLREKAKKQRTTDPTKPKL